MGPLGSAVALVHCEPDRLFHDIRVEQDVDVREPEDADPAIGEPCVAGEVRLVLNSALVVLSTIELDREAGGRTVEVERVRTDSVLAPELRSHAVATEAHPEFLLGVRRALTEQAPELERGEARHGLHANLRGRQPPLPSPLPRFAGAREILVTPPESPRPLRSS